MKIEDKITFFIVGICSIILNTILSMSIETMLYFLEKVLDNILYIVGIILILTSIVSKREN